MKKRPQSAPSYLFKERNAPSECTIVPRASISYDKNGHKVVKQVENNTMSSVLSTMMRFDKTMRGHDKHRGVNKTFNIENPNLLISELDLPIKPYIFDNMDNDGQFLSSTAISLRQMIQSKSRTSPWKDTDIPDWIGLREQYMTQLEAIATKILSSKKDNLIPDYLKKEMIALLRALRVVTLKIMRCYNSELAQYGNRSDPINETNERRKKFLMYLSKIPSSLDWLDVEPFQSICGLHLYLNPFCSVHNLSMELAIVINDNFQHVMWALQQQYKQQNDFETEDPSAIKLEPYNTHLIGLIAKDLHYSEQEDETFKQFYSTLISLSRYHDNNLEKLMSSKAKERKALEQEMNLRCEKILAVQHLNMQRRSFKKWSVRLKVVRNLKKFLRKRRKRIKKAVLKGLKSNIIKETRLRSLHKSYQKNLLTIVVESWKDLVIWCKRYRTLQSRCIDSWKRDCLENWKLYIEKYTHISIHPDNFLENHLEIKAESSNTNMVRTTTLQCSKMLLNRAVFIIGMQEENTEIEGNSLNEWKLESIPALPKEVLVTTHIQNNSCSREEWLERRSISYSVLVFLKHLGKEISKSFPVKRRIKLHPSF